MRITLTGAGGLIGKRLVNALASERHALHLLGRKPPAAMPPGTAFSEWNALTGAPPSGAFEGVAAVVHLAGENIAQRWDAESRWRIRESRVAGTQRLVEAMARASQPPSVLVSASAIGFYGSRGDEILTEESQAGSGFLADVCVAWEQAAVPAGQFGVRVVPLRIAMVLGRGGGALQRMMLPFQFGLGGPIGSGRQWWSWIHVQDLVDLILHCIRVPALRGPVNAAAPNPVTNAVFTRELAGALGRPAFLPVPPFALKALMGVAAEEIVLASQRVMPVAAQASNFHFRYAQLGTALREITSGRA